MSKQEIKQLRRDLEDRGFSLAAIGRELRVSRQTVSKALRNPAECNRVCRLIAQKLGRDPWAEREQSAA